MATDHYEERSDRAAFWEKVVSAVQTETLPGQDSITVTLADIRVFEDANDRLFGVYP